jgi:hypothetical protein
MSSSADCCIKLWAVEDLSCVKVILKMRHPDPLLLKLKSFLRCNFIFLPPSPLVDLTSVVQHGVNILDIPVSVVN